MDVLRRKERKVVLVAWPIGATACLCKPPSYLDPLNLLALTVGSRFFQADIT